MFNKTFLKQRANREKNEQSRILDQANNLKSSHDSRLSQIQQQLMLLSEREAQINHEKIAVYKQRQELEMFKSNISCAKCKEPVKDFGMMGLSMPSNFSSILIIKSENLR